MSDNVKFNWLLDHYGSQLTERQQDVLQLHYGDDLSISEIAEELNISRQAVHDSIQRGEAKLDELEAGIGFVKVHKQIQDVIKKARSAAAEIDENDTESREKFSQVIEWLELIDRNS